MMKKASAEALGTALLLTAVVGSGITGERLAGGNLAIALLANALVAGAALTVLTMTFRPVSGAHFNPVVTFAEASRGKISWRAVPIYVVAQLFGAVGGVVIAHLTLGEPAVTLSTHERSSLAEMVSELVATFGLLAVLIGCSRQRSEAVPFAVGAYVATAHWFTASASFANPVVTVARALTDSFAGTRPIDVPGLIVSQAVGGALATIVICWLIPAPRIELTAPELKREQLADDQARQAAVFLDSNLRVEKPAHVRV
jgi:glycerol uptake facilitator-like aquaporin